VTNLINAMRQELTSLSANPSISFAEAQAGIQAVVGQFSSLQPNLQLQCKTASWTGQTS
jgi:hypothetical protein